jgi:hypothetical protein
MEIAAPLAHRDPLGGPDREPPHGSGLQLGLRFAGGAASRLQCFLPCVGLPSFGHLTASLQGAGIY